MSRKCALGASSPVAQPTSSASLRAPLPVEVLEPALQAPLHFPPAAPFLLRWRPGGASQIVLRLIAARQDLGWGIVRCLAPDSGELIVPAALMARLPPPPRTIHVDVERDEERLVPNGVGPGVGMLVHAAFSAWQDGTDE